METADYFDSLAVDSELAADRALAVINSIQRSCVKNEVPSYHYCQDMQELTSTAQIMHRLAKQYKEQAKKLRM